MRVARICETAVNTNTVVAIVITANVVGGPA